MINEVVMVPQKKRKQKNKKQTHKHALFITFIININVYDLLHV